MFESSVVTLRDKNAISKNEDDDDEDENERQEADKWWNLLNYPIINENGWETWTIPWK